MNCFSGSNELHDLGSPSVYKDIVECLTVDPRLQSNRSQCCGFMMPFRDVLPLTPVNARLVVFSDAFFKNQPLRTVEGEILPCCRTSEPTDREASTGMDRKT